MPNGDATFWDPFFGFVAEEIRRSFDGKTALEEVIARLDEIERKLGDLMATEKEALDLLKKIDDASTKQGVVLAANAATLQEISDDIDRLLAMPGVPAAVVTGLQSAANKVQAISDNLDAQAAFSKAIASKSDPVPTPPPSPDL